MVLRGEGVWDVVCPPEGEVVEEVGGEEAVSGEGRGESRRSARASVIIFEYCDKASLSRILHCKDAVARWVCLKTTYGPRLSQLDSLRRNFTHGRSRKEAGVGGKDRLIFQDRWWVYLAFNGFKWPQWGRGLSYHTILSFREYQIRFPIKVIRSIIP